ncbi:MAG: RraA family protein, partial [Planctomycetes bacterium]|nr:RraA family protein [Planctomycetota bacterium]
MKKYVSALLGVVIVIALAERSVLHAQVRVFSKEAVLAVTSSWKGDRLPDGRPKVPDD